MGRTHRQSDHPGTDERWWRPYRRAGRTEVFHVDLGPCASREAAALEYLDDAESARSRRFVAERPRRQHVLSRAALRALLCERLGCGNDALSFSASRLGKPRALVDGMAVNVGFNLSHSGEHGLIALADSGRVGVDVEERIVRHDIDGSIKTVFAPAEQHALEAARGEAKVRLFFRLWTLKEALIKALGTGFTLETSGFQVPAAMLAGAGAGDFRFPHMPEVAWRLQSLGNARFAAATAQELPQRLNRAGPAVVRLPASRTG